MNVFTQSAAYVLDDYVVECKSRITTLIGVVEEQRKTKADLHDRTRRVKSLYATQKDFVRRQTAMECRCSSETIHHPPGIAAVPSATVVAKNVLMPEFMALLECVAVVLKSVDPNTTADGFDAEFMLQFEGDAPAVTVKNIVGCTTKDIEALKKLINAYLEIVREAQHPPSNYASLMLDYVQTILLRL